MTQNQNAYLLHQLTRFQALTVSQMMRLCAGRCKKTALYKSLRALQNRGLAVRVTHPTKPVIAYTPTPEAYPLVYGDLNVPYTNLKLLELQHTLLCSETLISLSHYANVTGIATEHELEREALQNFCSLRAPDGIIEITRGDLVYELAIEVEASPKALDRVQAIVTAYEKTFQNKMSCAGVIIVAGTPDIFERYRSTIEKCPQDIARKILLTSDSTLQTLNQEKYGALKNAPGISTEKLRTHFAGRTMYVPIKSSSYNFYNEPVPPQLGIGSGSGNQA